MAHQLIAFPTPVLRWAIGTQTWWRPWRVTSLSFWNERSLLSVAIPVQMVDRLLTEFPTRVYNLLRMIGVSTDVALRECAELETVVLARTKSRSVLGSLNEIALHYQLVAERDTGRGTLSLSAVERQLSRYLHGPLNYVHPADVAAQILTERYGHSV